MKCDVDTLNRYLGEALEAFVRRCLRDPGDFPARCPDCHRPVALDEVVVPSWKVDALVADVVATISHAEQVASLRRAADAPSPREKEALVQHILDDPAYQALQATGWSYTQAAKAMGITSQALIRHMLALLPGPKSPEWTALKAKAEGEATKAATQILERRR